MAGPIPVDPPSCPPNLPHNRSDSNSACLAGVVWLSSFPKIKHQIRSAIHTRPTCALCSDLVSLSVYRENFSGSETVCCCRCDILPFPPALFNTHKSTRPTPKRSARRHNRQTTMMSNLVELHSFSFSHLGALNFPSPSMCVCVCLEVEQRLTPSVCNNECILAASLGVDMDILSPGLPAGCRQSSTRDSQIARRLSCCCCCCWLDSAPMRERRKKRKCLHRTLVGMGR